MEGYTINTMSIGRHAPVLEWCQKKMALDLFEASSFELHTLQKNNKVSIFTSIYLQGGFLMFLEKCCQKIVPLLFAPSLLPSTVLSLQLQCNRLGSPATMWWARWGPMKPILETLDHPSSWPTLSSSLCRWMYLTPRPKLLSPSTSWHFQLLCDRDAWTCKLFKTISWCSWHYLSKFVSLGWPVLLCLFG